MSPMYNFSCDKCLEVYEALVPIDERDKEITCPECKEALVRLVSAPMGYVH